MQKRWVKIAIGVVAAIVLLLIVVPLFVNAETFRPTIESELSSLLGRRVTFNHLSFSLFSGSLVADDIAIADDPAFSSAPFLKANKLKADWEGIENAPNEALVSALAMMSPYGSAEKQALLEAPDLKTRAEILVAVTEIELANTMTPGDTPLQ